MAPKKKGKTPKKTKEELEEERRLQEEEEARLRAEEEKRLEEERKKRELEEAKRREEAAKNRAAELERLEAEYEAAKLDLEGKAHRLAELLRTQREAKEWEKYLACEPRPDAHIEGDMHSFLNSWLLEVSTDIHEVTAACASATSVIDDLLFVGANAMAINDTVLRDQCVMFTHKIQQMITEKIEFATAHILQYADEYADSNSRSEVKMSSVRDALKFGLWVNLIAKGSRNKKIEFQELGIAVDLPKAVILQSLALRALHMPFDPLSRKNPRNVDFSLGGVFALDLLAIPAPPKRARGWMIREVAAASDQIRRLHYPLEGMVASAAQPIKVSLALPPDVIYSSSTPMRVGWWDTHNEMWEEEGVSDVVFHPETSIVTFVTMKLTHLAVLQERDLNYRKYRWQLKMNTKIATQARLTMQTEHFACIAFDITDAGCRLVSPQLPQLEKLHQQWRDPGELLMRLTASGIGLCPEIEDDERFSFVPKLKMLEDRVIDEIVGIVSAYEVHIGDLSLGAANEAMNWSSAIDNPKQIVFAVKEIFWPYIKGNDDETDNPHPASGSFVNVLSEVDEQVSGGGVKFLIDRSENKYETHVHLKKALEEISSPDAKDRMENSNVLFEYMLKKMLRLLRLFSYSKPLTASSTDKLNGNIFGLENEEEDTIASKANGVLEDGHTNGTIEKIIESRHPDSAVTGENPVETGQTDSKGI